MKKLTFISANIYNIMRKISKKRNLADSAENHKEVTVLKKTKLKNSDKQGSDKFLNQCQKKFKKDCKIYTRKGELCFYNIFF